MSSTPDAIPRVFLTGLAEHVGRRVLLVAKVESVDPSGTTVTLSPPAAPSAEAAAAAGPRVLVQRPPGGGGGAYDTAFAEVDGVVLDATTLREESHSNFSDGFGALERGGVCSFGFVFCRHPGELSSPRSSFPLTLAGAVAPPPPTPATN